MTYKIALTILLCFATSTPAFALYKCVDKRGLVAYQERPCEAKGTAGQEIELNIPKNKASSSGFTRKKIAVGMMEQEVIEAWGRPTHINTTVRSGSKSEQWVYRSLGGSEYVYLTDGIVTSIQTPFGSGVD